MNLPDTLYVNRLDEQGRSSYWDTKTVHQVLKQDSSSQTQRTTERLLESSGLLPACMKIEDLRDAGGRRPIMKVVSQIDIQARQKRWLSVVAQLHQVESRWMLFTNDRRNGRRWLYIDDCDDLDRLKTALETLADGKNLLVWPHGVITDGIRALADSNASHDINCEAGNTIRLGTFAYPGEQAGRRTPVSVRSAIGEDKLSYLDRLEAESIHILREAVAQADNPVMLYSLGKDSSVMLHLAKKAFYPSTPPFPLLHVDTRWKFRAMYDFRDEMAKSSGMDLIVHVNPEGAEKDINPFDHGSALHTDVMKTTGLIQALEKYRFDVAIGGARRDEERSRAKERVYSLRTASHRWESENQRPEVWSLYNGHKNQGESIRVFPLSNWTEMDIWQYIYREQIPIVPLYFAAERAVVERDGMLLMVDDDRFKLFDEEPVELRKIRFRSLGCYPLTGAMESNADDLPSIILELLQSRRSERQGRFIDHDISGAMEKKKQAGYF